MRNLFIINNTNITQAYIGCDCFFSPFSFYFRCGCCTIIVYTIEFPFHFDCIYFGRFSFANISSFTILDRGFDSFNMRLRLVLWFFEKEKKIFTWRQVNTSRLNGHGNARIVKAQRREKPEKDIFARSLLPYSGLDKFVIYWNWFPVRLFVLCAFSAYFSASINI